MAQNRITSFVVWIFGITIVILSLLGHVSSIPTPNVIQRFSNGYDDAAENSRIADYTNNNVERISTLDKVPTDLGDEYPDLKRETRGAIYGAQTRDEPSIKHFLRIPATKTKQTRSGRRPAPIDPPDSEDEDNLESLEANREAFLDILDENAKRPRRKKPKTSHQSKILLRYDHEANRYTISEKSDEFN
ncbi:unnamed protein product [Orchesella dallaii]|uniref:Uncharacterized protein n=1 Tax=Orchesella dallaii TaxID=48710 RepID=A0ABP1Q6G9_9HEXA